jgi:phosphohistidine phosphatase
MRLYFLRHGIAEDADLTSLSDFSRILTPKGEQRTKATAEALKAINLKLTRLYSSPLVRARQTADMIGEALSLPVTERDELGPGFSLEAVAELIQDFNDDDSIMFVGHEPDFSSTIMRCIGGGDVVMKKGSLARIDVISREPLQGTLVWLLPAKIFSP